MGAPLRWFAVFILGLSCTTYCATAYAGNPQQTAVSSADSDPGGTPAAPPINYVTVPGPLRSFLRMAGISQKVAPEDVLPLLSRNSYLQGYEGGRETEFLLLLDRYVHQARELEALANANNGNIRVTNCEEAIALIQILGYRLRQNCGEKNVFLSTANPERAFLTIDSGFPLTTLEEALQKGTPFNYPFPATKVPVMFNETEWVGTSLGKKRASGSLIDVLINDPSVARLYWAFSKIDVETRQSLQQSPGLRKLLPYAAVIDFYGSQICIRSGYVNLPGGANAEHGWKDLVGASPDSPGDFVTHLLAKDSGWLAVYFDALSRVNQTQQAHLTQSPRLVHLYSAFRSPDFETNPTRSVFRKAPDLIVLFTRVDWDPDGQPHVPGNLEVWKEIFNEKTDNRIIRDWAKRSHSWDHPEQLLEAMTSLSRIETDSGPLQVYLMLSELDSARPPQMRLSDGTARLLASKFSQFSNWYLVFAEFPGLNDTSITRFVNVADAIDGISNQSLRGNALGAFQANIGLWQILARQGEIPDAALNTSWQGAIEPFAKVSSSAQLFDSARSSLGQLLLASTGNANRSEDEVVDLLAGPPQQSADGQRMRREIAARIRSVMDDQRLVSLDTLFALSDGLSDMAHGKPAPPHLVALAGELREFELPRPIFTNSEKVNWAPPVYSARHAELQIKTDLTKVIKSPGSPAQLETARGQLAPFLRDTLVGLNYAYYEPPGAQILHNNPLFVRSHDFSGMTIMGAERLWRAPELVGVGTPAGGGAYLLGSLADLPYALAETEEDFIAPENVQALIWKESVPDLLVSSTLPRWWGISASELHAVALYQRAGEELLTASVKDPQLRAKVITILSDRMTPRRLEWTEQAMKNSADMSAMLPRMMPADTFYLASEFRRRFPDEAASIGPASQQLDALVHQHPTDADLERLSKDFGVPHPTLARSYSREFLNVKPFPAFGGYSSRLFGESWESSNLYWARLADEMGYSPVMLNMLAPQLTRYMTAKIFATDLEDWPALLRAMQETGDAFRQGKIVTTASAATPDSQN
ncbi:hypothetical protein H7849_05775 [Alloacidobacterium dinghuense]|uniref:Uncharacterized protein n=1 Tax=Alloacidobacterium dinghuense TaxID=2763107 RepID=A0A7G8BLN7_9BACT|nr:hypothetical protein [Alloacidobacterium dinghuense]QNI33457.1 hypothetical protein H7849_05775 [Alloacidobacterium dinghuense]